MRSIRAISTALLVVIWLLRPAPAPAGTAHSSLVQKQEGVEFKIAFSDGAYTVYMRPNATPSPPGLTLTAQVTIKVPHGGGAHRFEVTNLQSAVAGTAWAVSSRVDAPVEDPEADYISFTVSFPGGNRAAYAWHEGEEIAVFTFENAGDYQGSIGLIENCDPFMSPNSVDTNPGNQITILVLGDDNAYLGNYDSEVKSCVTAPKAVYLPLIKR